MLAGGNSGRSVLRWNEPRDGDGDGRPSGQRCLVRHLLARIAFLHSQFTHARRRYRKLALTDAVPAGFRRQAERSMTATLMKYGHRLCFKLMPGLVMLALMRLRDCRLNLQAVAGMVFRHRQGLIRSSVWTERGRKRAAPSAHQKRKQDNAHV